MSDRKNAQAFVLISDGQSWSGEVAQSLKLAQERGLPVNVIGVGTTAGGIIPDPKQDARYSPLRSVLNRQELTTIATAGGGRYFELDRESDREIASEIIEQTRRRAGTRGLQEGTTELYWNLLGAAAVFVGLGALFLRDRVALALQLAAAASVLVFVVTVFR